MALKWMADRLKMGTWTHANRLYHLKKEFVSILRTRLVNSHEKYSLDESGSWIGCRRHVSLRVFPVCPLQFS